MHLLMRRDTWFPPFACTRLPLWSQANHLCKWQSFHIFSAFCLSLLISACKAKALRKYHLCSAIFPAISPDSFAGLITIVYTCLYLLQVWTSDVFCHLCGVLHRLKCVPLYRVQISRASSSTSRTVRSLSSLPCVITGWSSQRNA